jgi:hyperosmotically inducible periplasmic protein
MLRDISSCADLTKWNTDGGMMNRTANSRNPLPLLGVLLLLAVGLFAIPKPSSAGFRQEQSDNTKMNKGDATKDTTTADQQKMNPSDRAMTQKIRAEIMKDKSLSTYAHNVKIITQDGKVTLKGPVRTQDEKASVEAKAAAIAGDANVTSQIEIAPPKS